VCFQANLWLKNDLEKLRANHRLSNPRFPGFSSVSLFVALVLQHDSRKFWKIEAAGTVNQKECKNIGFWCWFMNSETEFRCSKNIPFYSYDAIKQMCKISFMKNWNLAGNKRPRTFEVGRSSICYRISNNAQNFYNYENPVRNVMNKNRWLICHLIE
jgi:hypothetical protein